MLWPSFQNPLSLVLYQTAFNSGKLSAERSFSKAKYELKGNGFLLMTMAQNWVSSFQTLKFAADISDFKTYFFLIMNLWIFLLVVGQAIRQATNRKGEGPKKKARALQLLATQFLSCCLFGSRDLREFATGLSPQITIQFSFCFPFLALLPRWQKT